MKKEKLSQKCLAFYKLYTEYKKDPLRYVPTWEFGGEVYVQQINEWGLMSYKCPTRLTEIFKGNPGLLNREQVRGRSGSKYYQYRVAPNPSLEKIQDHALLEFYKRIKNPTLWANQQSNYDNTNKTQ